MNNTKMLEMLNEGRIDELKAVLQDEIYAKNLNKTPDAKKRYAAMKKYFKMVDSSREVCQKPCAIKFEGRPYNSFTNSYSLALTTESCGEITMFDTERLNYPDISRLVDTTGPEGKIDILKVIAEAKSKGYKLKKSELMRNDYLMRYNGAYFRIGLLDSTYAIIANDEVPSVYHSGGGRGKLTVVNDIGICVVMPVYMEGGPDENAVVVEVENQ